MVRAHTVVRDPVHGDVELTRDELRLIDTREFQRLRGVKQLGTANLVYPGAVHTRFEHSLGTVASLERLLDAVDRSASRDPAGCHHTTADERRVLRIAALLHDVTHVPYGHNIEDQTGLLERHDVPARYRALLGDTELGDRVRELGVRDELLAILAGEGVEVPPFWRQVLSDTIDADLMDYLRRDAYYTGLELRYDDRVRSWFRVDRRSQRLYCDCAKDGMLRDDAVSELVRMLEIRYHFSERVYYHHAKVAAGALLARIVELAMRSGFLDAATLQRSTDESLVLRLEQAAEGRDTADAKRLGRFVDRFRRRALPKRLAVLPAAQNREVQQQLVETFFAPRAPQARFDWEERVETAARALLGRDVDVILYCPARAMQLKEARTLVRFPGDAELRPLEHHAGELPRLRDLRDQYPRLWKLYVFTSETELRARQRLQELCLAHLPPSARNVLVI
ncbi:MAG: HD domain-containing protein [Planctomycetes bacterium]|nr:HD domain-containing protein [Planctomycetota bacterium]